jgi:ankyrin repeat protein
MVTLDRFLLSSLVRVRSSLVLLASVACCMAGAARAADHPLITAARNADQAAVSALIEQGVDVSVAAADGSTALLWAAYNSDPDMARALLSAGADVDAANNYGVTPLLQSSRTGDTAVMAVLIDAGANVELAHPEGVTPLMAASGAGRADAVSMLLERGADVNAADEFQQQTALMWAASEGHLAVVEALLDAGADPDLQARVNTLTERKNADYASGGFSALMWAARNGYEAVVRRLAGSGADLNLTNGDGATAMMMSIVNDRYDLAAVLVELGANVDDGSLYHAVEMRDATTDWYARDGSRLRPNHDNELTALDLIRVLLEAGADPNKQFVGQMHSATMCCDSFANASPFFRAAIAADVEALKLLVAHGAELEWTPERTAEGGGPRSNANVGLTPIMVAMNGGKGVPLSAGPGYSREGPPPFREPSNREPADAVRFLLGAGANPDALDPDGEATLHNAVRAGKIEVVRALVEGGATLDLLNKDGLTALFLAENPLEEDESSPFGPQRDPGAAPEEVAAVLREAMLAAGIAIAEAQD